MTGVSVVIPTYNRPHFLERLLHSIERQLHAPPFEVIVVKDQNLFPEEYHRVIGDFWPRLPGFKLVEHDGHPGASAARNEGWRQARYPWVCFVDDDDEWMENKMESQGRILNQAPDTLGICGSWAEVYKSGLPRELRIPDPSAVKLRDLLKSNFIVSPSLAVRREALEGAAGFDETLPSCQDWDLAVRVMDLGYGALVQPEKLVIYHQHDGPSVGKSHQAGLGYFQFYFKHRALFLREGMGLYWMKTMAHLLKEQTKDFTPLRPFQSRLRGLGEMPIRH